MKEEINKLTMDTYQNKSLSRVIILQIILFYSRDPFLNLSRCAVKIMYTFATFYIQVLKVYIIF